ncbi:hypothetical protein DSO57_1003506 [Entomophthora muscae]|uniref:Uncharacterized protein n=1 Tax=Entomophthora muscae TaxID=34485 RepID=A0ACC2RNE3_9FUNG|nr:hypothetical protein DSO57_1003506 [Entomophthora muscae]
MNLTHSMFRIVAGCIDHVFDVLFLGLAILTTTIMWSLTEDVITRDLDDICASAPAIRI